MRQFLLYLFHPFVTVLLGMVCCSCGSAAEDDLIPADNRYLRLSLSPATELDAGATQIALKVETNLDYSVVVDAEWLKLQETTLPKDGSLHFSVEANPTSDTRTATIVVADRNDRYYSQSVKVVQRGNPNPVEELSIVDKQATAQTKALLANLWSIADKGFIFPLSEFADDKGLADLTGALDQQALFDVFLAALSLPFQQAAVYLSFQHGKPSSV